MPSALFRLLRPHPNVNHGFVFIGALFPVQRDRLELFQTRSENG